MTAPTLVWRKDAADAAGIEMRHPLDATKQCRMVLLSRMAGLGEVAVNLVTVKPGQQAFPFHVHLDEEEWVFVVQGKADVRMDDDVHALSAGDFAAFPSAGPAHSVTNTGPDDLVCLMGGQIRPSKVIDVPELGKRVIWTGDGLSVAPLQSFEAIPLPGTKA